MARKKKTKLSAESAGTATPAETTPIEAATDSKRATEHSDGALPATDINEKATMDQPRRLFANPAGRSSSFAKATEASPEYVGGPRPSMSVSLSGYSGGPAMHLLRSLRFKQMQIRFDGGQPDETYLATLKRAGWSDRTDSEGVWTKQIDPDARWQSVDRMEQEFKSVANAIRKDRGLEPVLQSLALA